MAERKTIIILAVFYVLGIAAGWGYYRSNQEGFLYRGIDSAIRHDLCSRIEDDLKKFKEYPQTTKRSSLNVLIKESMAVVQTQFDGIAPGVVIKFRSVNDESIVSECSKEARRWLKISSLFPELYENEVAIIEGVAPSAVPNPSETNIAGSSNQGRRIALVIGNSKYDNRPLKNPVNDATDMSNALKQVGFKVIELYDANDRAVIEKAISEYSNQLKDYDVGLVYYSGHGIEYQGRNYFIPVRANINDEEEIPRQGFDATQIVEKMSRNNIKTSIFIIDACRNVPVFSSFKSAKQGLAMMQGTTGSIVAFSAAPGQVALDGNERNSPYTSVLLKQMQTPNKKIEDVIKDTAKLVSEKTQGRQTPWYNSSLVGDFYFVSKQ